MKQHSTAPSTHIIGADSLFQAALQDVLKQKRLTQAKVQSILDEGPDVLLQFANHFETAYLLSGLKSAQERMVALISLSLEIESKGDISRAIELLRQNDLADLSYKGSLLLKELVELEKQLLEDGWSKTEIYNFFKTPNPWPKKDSSVTLGEKYNNMLANAQEKVAKNRCISLAKKHFPEAANGHDLIDIFTIVVAPDQLHKKEIHSKSFKVTIWDDFIKRYNLPKTLSSNMLIKELKIARTVDTSDDLSLTKDYPQWNALFQGKNPNSKALLSALLSGAAYGTMRKNLSESEVIEALETLRNIEIDSLGLKDYLHANIPKDSEIQNIFMAIEQEIDGLGKRKTKLRAIPKTMRSILQY